MRQPTELSAFLRDEIDRRHGGRVREAALYIGIAHTTLRDIILGASVPNRETTQKLAAWAKVPEDRILRLAGYYSTPASLEQIEVALVPILGVVPAGAPVTTYEEVRDVIPVRGHLARGKRLYGLQVKGNSMVESDIYDGDVVIVDPDGEPVPGKIAVVDVGGESTVKRLGKMENGYITLLPANHEMEPLRVRVADVRIVGVVVMSVRIKLH